MKKALILILGIYCSIGLMAQDIKEINLKTNDLIYVPSIDKIIVSVLANEINGNSICFIDPYHGEIEDCYFIGGSPNKLELSNDESILYIGLTELPEIVRFNLISKSKESSIQLLNEELDIELFAVDITVIPSEPNSIVVSRKRLLHDSAYDGTAVYDDGIMRPLTTFGHLANNSLAFGANGRLFGLNKESSGNHLREIIISAEGLTIASEVENLVTGFGGVIEGEGSYLYASRGERIYIENSVPQLVGRYSINTLTDTRIIPAPDSNVVYNIKNVDGIYSLITFNKTTYGKNDSLKLPKNYGRLNSLITWGKDGRIAFNAEEVLVIIRKCTPLIDDLILSPDTIAGCWGDILTVTAPDGYNKYYWSTGATTQSISLDNEADLYFYTADSLGCLSPHSNTIHVKFNSQPITPSISTSYPLEFCNGQSKTLTAIGNGKSFLWSTGETSEQIEVDSSGSFSVFSFSNIGCRSLDSATIVLTRFDDTVPDKPIIDIFGDTDFCMGGSVVLNTAGNYDIFHWSQGQNTSSIEVFYTGNYRVRVGNFLECISPYSDPILVRSNPYPARPDIIANGNTLASSAPIGNQWYLNGNIIVGAVAQFYLATENGFYTVQSTVAGCSSEMSLFYNHYLVSTIEDLESSGIKIFPNPTSDQINFILGDKINHLFNTIEVFNFTGNSIMRADNANSISLINFPNGMYFVRVMDKSGAIIKTECISKM